MGSLKERVKSLQADTSNTDTALTTLEESLAEKVCPCVCVFVCGCCVDEDDGHVIMKHFFQGCNFKAWSHVHNESLNLSAFNP